MFLKLLPGRQKPSVTVVADLDALISEPIGFQFKGRVYEIKPVDTATFMRTTNALGKIQELLGKRTQGDKIEDEEIYKAYDELITPLCPKFGYQNIKSATLAQLFAVVNLIIKQLTGQTTSSSETTVDEKKKSLSRSKE